MKLKYAMPLMRSIYLDVLLSNDREQQPMQDLKTCEIVSRQLDESTDICSASQ